MARARRQKSVGDTSQDFFGNPGDEANGPENSVPADDQTEKEPSPSAEATRPAVERKPKSPSRSKEHWVKKWLKTAKPTDWILAGAAVVGLATAFMTGWFDAQNAKLEARNDRLMIEQTHLEDTKRGLLGEIARHEEELQELRERLEPLEKESKSLQYIEGFISYPSIDWSMFNLIDATQEENDQRDIALICDVRISRFAEKKIRLVLDMRPSQLGNSTGGEYAPVFLAEVGGVLKSVNDISRIEEIRIADIKIIEDYLMTVNSLDNIIELNMINGGLKSEDFRTFKPRPNLAKLLLNDNDIDTLSSFAFLPDVQYLALEGNPINDDGLKAIENLFPNLEGLNVARTDITDSGFMHIAKLRRLWALDIRQTAVSSAALSNMLQRNPTIRWIRVMEDQFTPDELDKFRSITPNLRIATRIEQDYPPFPMPLPDNPPGTPPAAPAYPVPAPPAPPVAPQ